MTTNKITKYDAHIIGAMKSKDFSDKKIHSSLKNSYEYTQWETLISGISLLIITLLCLGYIAGSFIASLWFK